MLTKKELEYVYVPTSKAPFPGENYAIEACEKLVEAFKLYSKSYENKEYDIIMSNGNSITLEVQRRNLAHMLGIDFKQISALLSEDKKLGGGIINSTMSSYQVLEFIIDRLEDIIKHDRENSEKYLNYFKVMIKSTIFKSFSDFSLFDFGVSNFNKDNYDEKKYGRFNSNATTLLFTRSNELITPYYVMGLRTDGFNPGYIVETMYATDNIDRFISGQELVIPTQILMTDQESSELTKLTATSKEKIEILKMYQNILAQYRISANINIMADYESMLIEDSSRLTKK